MNKLNALPSSSSDRVKTLGAVYTPQDVADSLVRFVANNSNECGLEVLEPSCGEGAFVKSVCDALPGASVHAIDVDPQAIEESVGLLPDVCYECVDFFEFAKRNPIAKFDLVIGNPPYIRSSDFSEALKGHIDDLANTLNFPRSQIPNSWPAFVLGSAQLLKSNGSLALVVPYELITVKYAKFLISRILNDFKEVHIFVPEEKAFKEIDQDAVILFASGKGHKSNELQIHRVRNLSLLSSIKSSKVPASVAENNSLKIHSHILGTEQLELAQKLRDSMPKIGDLCSSAAGTVTAANSFFILSDSEIEKRNLRDFARPILQKSAFCDRKLSFDHEDFKALRESGKPCFVLDFSSLSFSDLPKAAQDYLEEGKAYGLHERYKCRKRTPWYNVPLVPSTDGFFFKRSHLVPRIYENIAGVYTTDSAYQIKMRDGRCIRDLCLSFFNTVTLLFSEMDGRFYGGGVLELTPKEFRGLPIKILDFKNSQRVEIAEMLSKPNLNQFNYLKSGDELLKRSLNLSNIEWDQLKSARILLQNHRLRHGSAGANNSLRSV